MDQESRQSGTGKQFQRRRLLLLVALGFALIAWGPRAAMVLSDGWCSSCRALEQQRQIDAAGERIDALQREVAYARTSEGRDVAAKRRFGVGPDDEIWITVEANRAPERRGEPKSVADRLEGWLADAGSRFVDRIRELAAIGAYWVGLEEVDGYVVVPEIEDEAPAGAPDSDSDASDQAEPVTGPGGEAGEDETEAQ